MTTTIFIESTMELKKLMGKSLLKTSTEETEIFGTHQFKIDGLKLVSFNHNDLIPLEIAEKKIEKHVFKPIIESCDGIIKHDLIPELTNFKNAERLKVFMLDTDKYFVIVSVGEYQPRLYRMYIECVFEKSFVNFGL